MSQRSVLQSSARQRLGQILLAIAILFFMTIPLTAQQWPQFRGPSGNGVVEKIEHPDSWGKDKNVAWTAELPGGGLSSPVISNDLIFVTSAVGARIPMNFADGVSNMRPMKPEKPVKFQVTCLNLSDGKKVWEKTVIEAKPEYPIHSSNSYATESPATDGERLYVYFAATGSVAAYDFKGNELWKQNIGTYPTGNGFGPGSSLTFGEGNVFVQCDNDRESFVVAFDAKTGKQAWKKSREGRTSWSTPLYWKNKDRSELITCGSGYVTSYDPKSGDELWTMSGISSAFSASPAADDSRIYFGNSGPRSSGPLLAVESGMSGKARFSNGADLNKLAWSKMQAGPGMSSPITVGDYLYVPGRGILTCYSAKDGNVIFKERMNLKSAVSSMWGSKEKIFLMDENGKALVIKPGPKMEIIGTNQIDDLFWSTPAVAGNSLLLRGSTTLYCIRK